METVSRGTGADEHLDPWYVTGYCEPGASFTYSRNGDQITLYFGVRAQGADVEILERLQAFFAVGKIYGRSEGSPYLRVNRIAELEEVVDHFDAYMLVGRKADAYAIWREMVGLKAESRGRKPPQGLVDLAEALSAANHH